MKTTKAEKSLGLVVYFSISSFETIAAASIAFIVALKAPSKDRKEFEKRVDRYQSIKIAPTARNMVINCVARFRGLPKARIFSRDATKYMRNKTWYGLYHCLENYQILTIL